MREYGRVLPIVGLLAFLALAFSFSAIPTHAQQSNWITSVSITDITGNSPVPIGQPLLAGHSYNVTLTIAVPYTAPARFEVALNSLVAPYGSQYWYIETSSYPGFSQASFTPGQKVVSFAQDQGELKMSAVFTIPSNITVTQAAGLTIRKELTDFPLVVIGIEGGSAVGQLNVNISDQVIQEYQATYSAKSNMIQSGRISPTYSSLVDGILAQAQDLASAGLPAQATALLGVINPADFPPPPNNSLMMYLLAGIGVLAVVAAASVLISLRRGSKYGYIKGLVGEVEEDLASLEVKAAQYDKSLADRLKRDREKLGEVE